MHKLYLSEQENIEDKNIIKNVFLLDNLFKKVKVYIASNKNCPIYILEKLAKDNDIIVRIAIAKK